MKLELTQSQLIALNDIFNLYVLKHTPMSLYQKLLQSILLKTYERIYKRLLYTQKVHKLNLETSEALAFILFFKNFNIPQELIFEKNLIITISNSIHQKYF